MGHLLPSAFLMFFNIEEILNVFNKNIILMRISRPNDIDGWNSRRLIGCATTEKLFPARPGLLWQDERGRKFLGKIGQVSGSKRAR